MSPSSSNSNRILGTACFPADCSASLGVEAPVQPQTMRRSNLLCIQSSPATGSLQRGASQSPLCTLLDVSISFLQLNKCAPE